MHRVEQFSRWESAEYLKTEEDMADFLDACMEVAGGDCAFVAKTLVTIARARGSLPTLPKGAGETPRIWATSHLRARQVQGYDKSTCF